MAMTPEEYADKEWRVPGWEGNEAPTYAPGYDPNIPEVLNGGAIKPGEPPVDTRIATIQFEYNFTLPLALKRAELETELKKHLHLDARTGFWHALSLAVLFVPVLAFIAVLVK